MQQSLTSLTLEAGADLRSAAAGTALALNSLGQVIIATASTDVVVGMLGEVQDSGVDTTGRGVQVVTLTSGTPFGIASASITAGQLLVATTGGKVAGVADIASVAANSFVLGVALEGASADETVTFVASPMTGTASA